MICWRKRSWPQKIISEIQRRRLTQSQAATILGIDQPKVSALKQGSLSGFSIERLMRLLLRLGRDIEITVKAKTRSRSAARGAWYRPDTIFDGHVQGIDRTSPLEASPASANRVFL